MTLNRVRDLETRLAGALAAAGSLQEKVDLTIEHAWNLAESDPSAARELLEANELIAQSQHPRTIANVHLIFAYCECRDAQFDLATARVLEALAIYDQLKLTDIWRARGYFILAHVHDRLGNYADSMEYTLRELELVELLGDAQRQSAALRRIGVIHAEVGDHQEAQRYYERSLKIALEINSTNEIAAVYNNFCYEHLISGDLQRALEYGQRGLELFEQSQQPIGLSRQHGNLGLIYIERREFDRARQHFDHSLAFANAGGSVFSRVVTMLYLARMYSAQGSLQQALEIANMTLALAEETQLRRQQVEAHELLAELYETNGNLHAALTHSRRAATIHHAILAQMNAIRLRHAELLQRLRKEQAESELQRRLREQERQQYAQLSQMKDELLHTATHDLKSPLTSIGIAVDRLRQMPAAQHEMVARLLNRIESSTERMSALISDTLDLARLETGGGITLEKTDLVPLLQTVVAEFEERVTQRQLRLALHKNCDSLLILIDQQRIEQVLHNLLSNAIKYTDSGGSITLTLENTSENCTVRVADNGIGIPQKDLPHIFDRFYRVREQRHEQEEGTGLGLAIAKSIIEQHQGMIWVESTAGVGTVISFTLPNR